MTRTVPGLLARYRSEQRFKPVLPAFKIAGPQDLGKHRAVIVLIACDARIIDLNALSDLVTRGFIDLISKHCCVIHALMRQLLRAAS